MRLLSTRARLAATFCLASVVFGGGLAHAQDPARLEEAKKHMEAGAAFYNDPSGHKCEEAYREFRKAFDLSGSLNALKGMGVCALELERDGDAIAHYEKYIRDKGEAIDPADKAQIENDLKALKASVAWVSIRTDRPNVQIIDVRTPSRGFPVTNRYVGSVGGSKLGIHPGSHTFTARSEGAPDITWSVEIANGGTYERYFEFDKGKPLTAEGIPGEDRPVSEPPPVTGPAERPIPTTVFIFGGLTVALAVPTVIFMVSASGAKSDFDDANGTVSLTEAEDLRSTVQTNNLLADIFLGATVLSLAATGFFFFTRPEVAEEAPKAASFQVLPTMGRSGGGAMAIGTF